MKSNNATHGIAVGLQREKLIQWIDGVGWPLRINAHRRL